MADGTGLPIGTAPRDGDLGIEFVSRAGGLQGLRGDNSQRFDWKIILKWPAIDEQLAGAGGQTHTGDGGFTPAGADMLWRFGFGNLDIGHTRASG